MMNDRYRIALFPILIAVLAWLGFDYGHMIQDQLLLYREARADPTAYRDRDVALSFWRVGRVEAQRFFVWHFGQEVEIRGRLEGLEAGDIASLRGRIRADLSVELRAGHIHRGRRLKWILGASTLALVMALLASEVRRDA